MSSLTIRCITAVLTAVLVCLLLFCTRMAISYTGVLFSSIPDRIVVGSLAGFIGAFCGIPATAILAGMMMFRFVYPNFKKITSNNNPKLVRCFNKIFCWCMGISLLLGFITYFLVTFHLDNYEECPTYSHYERIYAKTPDLCPKK